MYLVVKVCGATSGLVACSALLICLLYVLLQVVSAVLRAGQNIAKKEGRHVPLLYMWHGKYYLGGAHGIAGILYILLQVKKGEKHLLHVSSNHGVLPAQRQFNWA